MDGVQTADGKQRQNGIDEFPDENPTDKQMADWLDANEPIITSAYGAALRGEVPIHLKLFTVDDDLTGYTELPSGTQGMRADQIQTHNMRVRKARADKARNATALADGLRDHKNQLAQVLTVSLRPRAELRLKRLLAAHKVARHDAHDGVAMFQALLALRGSTGHYEEPVSHDRAMERMRDEYLTDHCALREYTEKVNTFKRDHLEHLTCPMAGVALSKFIVNLMPKCNKAEGRDVVRRMTAANTFDQLDRVIEECCTIVRDSQSPDLRAAAMAQPAASATRGQPSQSQQDLLSTVVSAAVKSTVAAMQTETYGASRRAATDATKTAAATSAAAAASGDKKGKEVKRLPEDKWCKWNSCHMPRTFILG